MKKSHRAWPDRHTITRQVSQGAHGGPMQVAKNKAAGVLDSHMLDLPVAGTCDRIIPDTRLPLPSQPNSHLETSLSVQS